MPEQTKQKQQDQEPDMEDKARRGRGGRDAREDRHQRGRGGQQYAKDEAVKRNEPKIEEERSFESAGRGVRAKPGLDDDQAEKKLDDKSEELEPGAASGSEDEGDDDSPSTIRGAEPRAKKTNRDLDESDTS